MAYVSCVGLPLNIWAAADYDTICINQTNPLYAAAYGGTGNYTYSWSPATNLDDPSSQSPVFTATEAGEFTYTVTVSDGNDTATTSLTFTVIDNTGVEEIEGSKVSVYPNPASSTLNTF